MKVTLVEPPAAQVELISWTGNAVSTIAKVTRTYEGVLSSDDSSFTYEASVLEQLQKTELQGPLEMIHFVWLIKDVTRAFTHQLVRYRVGTSFAQESLRFSNKSAEAKVLCTLPAGYRGWEIYRLSIVHALTAYSELISEGIPVEDARGLLPTNILTSIFFDCSLRTLIHIWAQRMCHQAQVGEWQTVLQQMKQLMPDSRLAELLTMPCQRGLPCTFASMWDRPCLYRR